MGDNRKETLEILHRNKIGEKHITNQGFEVEIVEFFCWKNCTIRFTHNGRIVKNREYKDVKKGSVKNLYHPSVYDVGYMGEGAYKYMQDGKESIIYTAWNGMMERCYSEKTQEKQPTYKGCTVAEEWHNFQNFAAWFEESYKPEIMEGWQLDKDILCPECRQYNPETCTFVPREINVLFSKMQSKNRELPIGVVKREGKFGASHKGKRLGSFKTIDEAFQAYKAAREKHVKQIADKWKGLISDRVYDIMMKWEISVTN